MSCNLPWPNQKPNKVDLWIFILRNHHLITDTSSWWSEKEEKQVNNRHCKTRERISFAEAILVVSRGFEFRVQSHHLCNERMSLFLQFLACTIFTRVKPLALAVVDGLRRWRPVKRKEQQRCNSQNLYAVLTPSTVKQSMACLLLTDIGLIFFCGHLKSAWDAPECSHSNEMREK